MSFESKIKSFAKKTQLNGQCLDRSWFRIIKLTKAILQSFSWTVIRYVHVCRGLVFLGGGHNHNLFPPLLFSVMKVNQSCN